MKKTILSKALSPVGVEADVENHQLLINYKQTTSYQLSDATNDIEVQLFQKKLPLSSFTLREVEELADELLRQSALIDPKSRDQLVKQLRRLCGQSGDEDGDADIGQLPRYTEMLYDDLQQKLAATSRIAALSAQHKAQIAANEVLMSALARTLSEDGLKHMQLGQNITQIFYSLSFDLQHCQVLLRHRVFDSLNKMIQQENRRYSVMYNDLASKKKQVGTDKAKISKYQLEHSNFKQVVYRQDQLLIVAVNTLINLIEASQQLQAGQKLFIPIDTLVKMLSQCIKRKPINLNLLKLSANVLQKVSTLENGLEAIQKAEIVDSLLKIVTEDKDNQVDDVMLLLYNLTFNPELLYEMKEKGAIAAVTEQYNALNSKYIQYQAKVINPKDTFEKKMQALTKNAKNDQNTAQMEEQLLQYTKFACRLNNGELPPEFVRIFSTFACGSQNPEIFKQLAIISTNQDNAQEIANSGLLNAFSDKFQANKDESLAKVFANVTAAIPSLFQAQSSQPNSSQGGIPAPGKQNKQTIDLMSQISKITQIALATNNKTLQLQALNLMAHAPPKLIDPQQAKVVARMAIETLKTSTETADQLNAISVFNNFFSKHETVQLLSNEGHLKELAPLLLEMLVKSQVMYKPGFDVNIGQFGLQYAAMEPDLAIETMLCILRGCTYKALRGKFLRLDSFILTIVRFLYNQKRVKSGQKPQKDKEDSSRSQSTTSTQKGKVSRLKVARKAVAKEENVFKSTKATAEERTIEILAALADTILDVLTLCEEQQADIIRRLKFQRYNWEFFSSKM